MLASDSQRLLSYDRMCSLTIECVRLPDVLLRTSVNKALGLGESFVPCEIFVLVLLVFQAGCVVLSVLIKHYTA